MVNYLLTIMAMAHLQALLRCIVYSLTGAYTVTVTAEANVSCPAKSFRSLVIVNDNCETPVCVNNISLCHPPTACINKEWSIENNTITPSSGQLFTYRYGDWHSSKQFSGA